MADFELAPGAFDAPINWFTPPVVDGSPAAKIKTTSVTRMHKCEQCPRMLALAAIGKVPEPEREGPDPRERGSELHNHIENFIVGKDATLNEAVVYFRDDPIEKLKERYAAAPETVEVENMWRFDRSWKPVADNDWDNTWLFVKLDVLVKLSSEPGAPFDVAVPIDWKSGKKYGNEIKHGDQLITYNLATLARYDSVVEGTGELFYIDKNESISNDFTRAGLSPLYRAYTKRLSAVTDREIFEPTPSKHHCRWCPYKTGELRRGEHGSGHCKVNP